jgi:diacylglycerol kinase
MNLEPPRRSWFDKFGDAIRGVWVGMRGQSSFGVHLWMAVAVVALGRILRVNLVEWCLLFLCITAVLAAELFNTAIERLAREIDRRHNSSLGTALDIASGAVLVTSIGSAVVGCVIFGYRLGVMLESWR